MKLLVPRRRPLVAFQLSFLRVPDGLLNHPPKAAETRARGPATGRVIKSSRLLNSSPRPRGGEDGPSARGSEYKSCINKFMRDRYDLCNSPTRVEQWERGFLFKPFSRLSAAREIQLRRGCNVTWCEGVFKSKIDIYLDLLSGLTSASASEGWFILISSK